jgi:SRSO17 transposase
LLIAAEYFYRLFLWPSAVDPACFRAPSTGSSGRTLPPKASSGRGIRPTRLRREPGNEPVAVKAMELPQEAYSTITWREGTNTDLSSRFAAVRDRPAHRDYLSTAMRPEEWLLIEWPEGETEPAKYFLCTGPSEATLEQLVFVTKMRWRIERDYQELKQGFGLTHHEGRGWRGFHHHATLCIAAYAFLVTERLRQDSSKKTALDQKRLPYPKVTSLAAAGRL